MRALLNRDVKPHAALEGLGLCIERIHGRKLPCNPALFELLECRLAIAIFQRGGARVQWHGLRLRQANGQCVGGDQPAGEGGARFAIPLDGVQSGIELAHHVGQYGHQLATFFGRRLGLYGPDQLLHGLGRLRIVVRTRGLIHPGPCHDLAPLVGQEWQQEWRHRLFCRQLLYAFVDLFIRLLQRMLPRFTGALLLGNWFHPYLGLLFRLEQELGELAQQVNKQRQVVFELGQHTLHGVLDAHIQRVLFTFFGNPRDGRPCQGIHQAAGRVLVG